MHENSISGFERVLLESRENMEKCELKKDTERFIPGSILVSAKECQGSSSELSSWPFKACHFSIHSSVALRTLTWPGRHHHHPSPELLYLPELTLHTHEMLTPQASLPIPQPLVIAGLLAVLMSLTTLGSSYTRNHTIFVLLRLAHFTSRKAFKVHLYWNVAEFYSFFEAK